VRKFHREKEQFLNHRVREHQKLARKVSSLRNSIIMDCESANTSYTNLAEFEELFEPENTDSDLGFLVAKEQIEELR
jgi:hypothetical protein